MRLRTRMLALAAVLTAGILCSAPGTGHAQTTPKVFFACYVPSLAGTTYRIKEPGLSTKCFLHGHVEFSWTDGVAANDHGALNGLLDDDHPQYLLASGTRPLAGNLGFGGFKIIGLGAGAAAGDAVRFEQAVKMGDVAGGDLLGTYPNPSVVALQGQPVSNTAPTTTGQVLAWNGSAWTPATSPTGVTDHGLLSGLSDDDHPQYLLGNGVRATTHGFAVTGTFGSGTIPFEGAGVRVMWYPGKAAFRAGRVEGARWNDANVGVYSTALGFSTTASGQGSTALGEGTTASGQGSTALGEGATASGTFATALGFRTTASGNGSTALGFSTTASSNSSTALGLNTTASGIGSTALGYSTNAIGDQSTALGFETTASGAISTALGNLTTASGDFSTAMGRSASTNGHPGAFVYGDASTFSNLIATADNQFLVRAAGGTIFYSNSALSAGVQLSPGDGAWASVSDRTKKEHFRDDDGERVLAQIAGMPVQSWNYKAQTPAIRHLGPTAQDFYTAFHLGESDTTISTVDADGVSLLAIQALEKRTRDLEALRGQVAALARANEQLRAEVTALRTERAERPVPDSLVARTALQDH